MMFHRPSVVGGDSNIANASRPRALVPQNENIHLSAKATKASNTTTPAAKSVPRPRRAFGDISNKKSTTDNNKNGKDLSNNGNKAVTVLKPHKSSAALTPHNNGGPKFQSRIPKTAVSKITKRSHPWSTQGQHSSSVKSSPQLASSRQVDFILPTTTRSAQKAPEVNSIVEDKVTFTNQVPVEDVELPAGRLWEQQLKMDDPFGEDELSTGSLGEALDPRTMWDDWKETMLRQWGEEREQQVLEDEREVRAHLDKFLQEDRRGKVVLH